MKKQIVCSVVLLITIAALVSVSVYAASEEEQSSKQDRPKGPPPEAFELCKSKSAGDTVTITNPQGEEVEGVCKEMRGEMVAVPVGMKQKGGKKSQ